MHLTLVKRLGLHFIDLIFPIVCIECRKEGLHLCLKCQNRLHKNEFQICPVCGKLSPFGITHSACKTEYGLDGLISAVPYKDPIARKLVEFCKYRFIAGVSEVLAELMIKEIKNLEMEEYFNDFIMVPLPLHPSKKRWRGYNQAELISNHACKFIQIPSQTDLLSRKIKTKSQAELKDEERITNVKNAFESRTDLSGKKILIVDDVSTTRSTLKEACIALKQKGASEVWGLTFAQG